MTTTPPSTPTTCAYSSKGCKEQKITYNTSKWVFGQPTVPFAGFLLSKNGYQIDPAITKAITNFPTPSNRTALQSFIGLVNQLSSSTSTIAHLLSPFRPLLSTKNEFTWSEKFLSAFEQIKNSITSTPVVSYTLTSPNPRDCSQMPADRDSASYYNRSMTKHGTWYKLGHDSSPTQSHVMPSSN